MIRVVVGALAGICAGLVAPTFGARLIGIGVTSITRSKTRNRLSAEVFIVITIFSALFILIAAFIENWAVVVAAWALSLGLITASWIDAYTHRLPRKLSYATLGIGFPLLVIAAIVEGDWSRVVNSLIGIVVATVLVGFLFLIGRGAMGEGDVRLAPVIGLYAGWISIRTVISALVISFFLAAIFALALLVLGRAKRSDEIPLGPFLAWGTLAVFVYSAAKAGL